MRKHSGRGRLVRGLGGLLTVVLMTSGLAVALGGGVASATTTSGVSLWDNQTPSLLQQNTRGYGYNDDPISGAGAAWVLRVSGDWQEGDTFAISVVPNSIPFDVGGGNCGTPIIPPGVNQSTDGLRELHRLRRPQRRRRVSDGPILFESTFTAGEAPDVSFDVTDDIGCSRFTGTTSYETLLIMMENDGNGNPNQTAEIILGKSFDNNGTPHWEDGPVLFDVGYGATTGPAHFSGHFCPASNLGGNPANCEKGDPSADPEDQWVDATATFDVASSVTVTGQRPAANNPRTTLVRDTRTDWIEGPISEFTISEDVVNALPPTDGYMPEGLPGGRRTSTCRPRPSHHHRPVMTARRVRCV